MLGYDFRYFAEIREGIEILKERGVANPTVAQAEEAVRYLAERTPAIDVHGGPRVGAGRKPLGHTVDSLPLMTPGRQRNNQVSNGNLKTVGSNRVEYLASRIARDRPDILERMKAGEFSSVRQAAIEAGFVTPEFSCPLDPQKAARRILNRFRGDSLLTLVRVLANHAGYDLVGRGD